MRFRPLLVPSLLVLPVLSCRSTPAPQEGDGHSSLDASTAQGADVDQRRDSAHFDTSNAFASRDPRLANTSGSLTVNAVNAAASGSDPKLAAATSGEFDPTSWLASIPSQQDFLEDAQSRLELTRDKERKLSDKYVESGRAALERADLEAALQEFARALDIRPTNEAAREGFLQTKALLGDENATAQQLIDNEVDRLAVIRAEARIAAGNAMNEGDTARKLGDYDSAIAKYREAEVILNYNPLIADDEIDRKILDRKLESATAERDANILELEAQSTSAADEARLREEEAGRNYRYNTLAEKYRQANEAFVGERYDDAEDLAQQILRLDPGNDQALAMREIAMQARFQKRDEELFRTYREQWQLTMASLEREAVPQVDSLVFDDLDRYLEVLDREPYGQFGDSATADPAVAALSDLLKTTRVSARFGSDGEGTPLETVADYLDRVTGVNFLISPEARDLDVEVALNLDERPVLNLLQLIDELNEELAWKIDDGAVKFVTEEEGRGDLNLEFYEVRDLVTPPKDFQALDLNVIPSEGIEYPDEDPREPEATVITGDDLASLIQDNIEPDSWDEASVDVTETGTLIVYQTPEVHAQIVDLLTELREAAGLMVQIQARFLRVADNFLEDIGVDFRGLGAPGLGDNNFFNDFGPPGSLNNEIGQDTDLGAFYENGENGEIKGRVENLFDLDLGGEISNSGGLSFQWTYLNDLQLEMVLRAVSKSERVELVTAPSILVYNTARSNLQVLNQVAYVQDYSVEIATSAAIADPQIQVVQDGVVLDVRPVISADRRFITLDLRPTIATLQRPIQEFTTSLATTGSVTIQLPQLELQRIRTVVSVPDGGTVLLGGLKLYEEQNLTSGVPILNKIPVLNFFFERKGNYISKQKTLILLRSSIVIPSEVAPTPAQLGRVAN